VNFGFRDYDPELREWTSLDPLMQDSNPYRYCFDDPLHFLDPDGRFALVVPILTWGGAAITSPIWGTGALAVAGGMVVGYLGYKGYQLYQDWREDSYGKMDSFQYDRTKAGELQKQVEKGQAPGSVDRVDKARGPHEKEHVHFKDGPALNHDGTWKHKEREITNKEQEWLEDNGWVVP
jgi:hypothetical protein